MKFLRASGTFKIIVKPFGIFGNYFRDILKFLRGFQFVEVSDSK